MSHYIKLAIIILSALVLTGVIFVIVSNLWVYNSTKSQVFDSIAEAPNKDVALVLGTSNKLMNGKPNPYFNERIEMAATLLKQGKVKHIIVSGDNRTKYYNEPIKMYNALIELGVSKENIDLDYAGVRTLDSIIRCKKIFGQDNIIIITQPFHSHRALFISKFYKIDAISLSITDIPFDFTLKVRAREYLARALAIVDLYILQREPKHLGKKENINI